MRTKIIISIIFKNSSNNKFTIKKVAANKVAFVVTDASDGTIKFILNSLV
jgi:hypothetical protein